MPAPKTVTVIVRAVGARAAARELEKVERSVGKVDKAVIKLGDGTKRASTKINAFARAMTLLRVRMINISLASAILGTIFIALGPEILAVVSAATTAISAFGILGLVLAGTLDRLKQTGDIVGRPAYRARIALRDLQKVARNVIAPGADLILGGLANAIRLLMPLLKQLKTPLTVFAGYVTGAIDMLARGLLDAGPQLISLIARLGPFMLQFADLVINLMKLWLNLASGGVPTLDRIMEFVNKLLSGNVSLPGIFDWLWKVAVAWRRIFRELGGIIGKLYEDLKPLITALGQGLLWALEKVGDALEWTNRHWEDLNDFIAPIAAAILAIVAALKIYGVVLGIVTAAQAIWDALLLANPIGLIILAVIGLAAALVVAYNEVEWFHNAIDRWWDATMDIADWIVTNWNPIIEGMAIPFEKVIGALAKVAGWLTTIENTWPWFFGKQGTKERGTFDAATGIMSNFLGPAAWIVNGARYLGGQQGAGTATPNMQGPQPTMSPLPQNYNAFSPAPTDSVTQLTLPITLQLSDGTKLAEAVQQAILKAQSVR